MGYFFTTQVAQRDAPTQSPISKNPRTSVVRTVSDVAKSPPSSTSHQFVTARRPSVGAHVDSPLLNRYIKDCRTWEDLSELVDRHGSSFNFIHVAACMTHLAQLRSAAVDAHEAAALASTPCRLGALGASVSHASWPNGTNDEPVLATLIEELLLLTEDHLHQFGARQATNVLWSLAHLHPLHPSGCALLASEMLPMMRALLPWCEPQHLSNIIWAVAKLEEACPGGLSPDDAWLEEFLVCSERTVKVR